MSGCDLGTGRGIDDATFDALHRGSDRPRLVRAVVGRDVARSGQLGHSVNLFHVAAGTARTCGDEVAGHRRGADRHHVQAREVVVVEQVSVGQRLDDRGNDLGACHVVALDRVEEPLDLEPGHQHHARAGPQGQVERDLEPERVHERQRGEHGVAARHTMGVAHLTQAGDEVAMGQHDALGQPAGAAGTREKRRVGGTGQPGREAALPRGDDLLECRSSGRIAVDDERPSDRGTERRIAQDALEQVRCRENPARIRREEVIGELAGLRMRADRCDGRTDVSAAYHATTKSMLFVEHSATTSPGRTPAARRPCPARPTLSTSSAYVRASPEAASMSAQRPPCSAASPSTYSGSVWSGTMDCRATSRRLTTPTPAQTANSQHETRGRRTGAR